jgi:chromate reductase, NAD(P)H dehydrogenase (quinone)
VRTDARVRGRGRVGGPDDLRRRFAACDGVIISCPEYVHGVPGALKNAIDWVVSSGEFYEKPAALLNASMAAAHAYASLTEVLTTADACVFREASVRLGLPTKRIDERGILSDPELSGALQAAVAAFARAIRGRQTETDGRVR